jgi:V-type H+-transporting ATPase subunit F
VNSFAMASSATFKNRTLLAVIGDEVSKPTKVGYPKYFMFVLQDTITGLLLAGIGHINENQKKNFLVVDAS